MLNHFQYVIEKKLLPCCNKKNLIFSGYILTEKGSINQNIFFRNCLSFSFSFEYRCEQIYFLLMPMLTSLDVNTII